MFDREELIALREKAKELASTESINEDWKRALLYLADVANNLDAMIARTIISTDSADSNPAPATRELSRAR